MQTVQFIQVTPEQLQNAIIEGVKSQLEDLKKHFQPKEPKQYLGRQEVAKMLSVDLSTVHNWTKKGILTANQIGGRVFYLRSDVENAIVKLKN
ncbi:helix-turn-helix domain-containing protein [Psychroserpens mesophilus]|uniref:helix-turn-helix domain-containing protein n=1 Tax=Psychroserpens mesophilus TaxID=325473 RepID=UPI00058CDA67|nr:helix-turn-helix domain-containing protein [Psychroserpens mesophilus]